MACFLTITALVIKALFTGMAYNKEEAAIYVKAASLFTSKHGQLSVKGNRLTGKNGKPVQLKGASTHGINWDIGYPYVNEASFKTIRDQWGANTIRLAMYTEDYNGYCVTDNENRGKSSR